MSQTQLSVNEPIISVIIPLVDDRGQGLACIKSWAQEQIYARKNYEVVAVTNGSNPALEDQAKALLAPHDLFIQCSSNDEFWLYDLGARRARGKLLFFTEAHCLGTPACLAEVAQFFASHDAAGARCRSIGLSDNLLAEMEEKSYEETYTLRSTPGHWYRIALRGFAIYRHLYLEMGGLEYEFGLFSEPALAAKLHGQGYRLAEAMSAVVRHYNTTTLAELFHFVRDFARGECGYRAKYPPDYCERYFGHATEWSDRAAYHTATARRLCRTISKGLWLSLRSGRLTVLLQAQLKALWQYGPVAFLGARWPLLTAQIALTLTRLRLLFWQFQPQRYYQAYCDFWVSIAHYSRLEFIHENFASILTSTWPETCEYDLAQTEAERLIGFYAVETWQGQTFRWGGPVALAQLSLPQGAYEAQLQLLPIRPPQLQLHLQLFFNGCRISSFSQDATGEVISFRVEPAMFVTEAKSQHLVLMCNPLQPWKHGSTDRRELGLPVRTICFSLH